jgi:hypothetical protein
MCQTLQQMSQAERHQFVMRRKICYNCLGSTHVLKECPSQKNCADCGARHHTMLHRAPPAGVANLAPPPPPAPAPVSAQCENSQGNTTTILPTVIVSVKNGDGVGTTTCRALLDSGSEVSFITEACLQRLKLSSSRSDILINGIGDFSSAENQGTTQIDVLTPEGCLSISAVVMKKLTRPLSSQYIDTVSMTKIHRLPLADPSFNRPGPIDLILGGDVYDTIVLATRLKFPDSLFLRETLFG